MFLVNAHAAANPFLPAFRASSLVLVLTLAAFLCVFVSPLTVVVPLAAVAAVWVVLQNPTGMLGLALALMPLEFMVIALGKFFGLPHMTLLSILDKEVLLLVLALIFWWRRGIKLAAPDWFVIGCFAVALVRTLFAGSLVYLAGDLVFIVPYLVGRMTVLSSEQENRWASRAVWIVAILALLGLIEVFIVGEAPRTALYLAIDSETEGGQLATSFHAAGFAGLREAATMVGPNGFGALCMIALVVWWVYGRNIVPAIMASVGLICSVTRSAWVGTAVAITVVALLLGQQRRLLKYVSLAAALFVASIPILGLGDYIRYNKSGQDPSTEWHREQIVKGIDYALQHPLGSGNEKMSPLASKQIENATIFETTYPALASEYGLAAVACFLGFIVTSMYVLLRSGTRLGYAALGILIAMSVVLVFTNPLVDRRLGCWAWFPVGMAVRAVASQRRRSNQAVVAEHGL